MLYTTRGIVLHQIRYSESSVIVKIYTEAYGLKTYIFKGVHSKRAKVRSSLLQHLNLVELVSEDKDYGGLSHPKELRLEHPYRSLTTDMKKSSIALFINDVLLHSIRQEEADPELFSFLHNALVFLDETRGPVSCFHLWFCAQLTRHLGFAPQETNGNPRYLNMREGIFQEHQGAQEEFMDEHCSLALHRLLGMDAADLELLNIPYEVRTRLIRNLLYYYMWHISDFGEVKSHLILAEILS